MGQIGVEPTGGARIELFGGLRATVMGQQVSGFRTKKTASLLAYLAFFKDLSHSRDFLVELLWPDSHYDAGRQSLRMALSSLRESLGGGGFLVADRSTVRLNNVTTDVQEFDVCVASDDIDTLSKALRLVRGPLLSGYDESWVVTQWLRLEEAYAQAAVRVMALSEGTSSQNSAVLLGKEAAALLGPREDVHLALISLFSRTGQVDQALAQFEELERVLNEQWGEPPSDAAYELMDSLPERSARKINQKRTSARVPARTSSFYGRDAEIDELSRLLKSGTNRLLTVVGPGGCGKTALANVVALAAESWAPERTWSVGLADVDRPERVIGSLAEKLLGAKDAATVDDLAELFKDGPCLLVLDNLEQLLPQVSTLVKDLLTRSPYLKILATSRTVLAIDGEQIFPLSPLPVPTVRLTLTELARVPSVALFVDRASAQLPTFKLGPDNAAAISEICRKLDGLPLAIELAAAKSLVHSPAQILANLGQSVDFLTSRKADLSERHRSLRATLDWSLDLLDEETRDAFFALGVFKGGFDVELGQRVASGTGFDSKLETLVASSLVLHMDTKGDTRFKLLEPVREYAISKLGPGREAIRRRHFEAFEALVKGGPIFGPERETAEWFDRLDANSENLASAFECVFDGVVSHSEAADLALNLRSFSKARGKSSVWRNNLDRLKSLMAGTTDHLTLSKVTLAHAIMCSGSAEAKVSLALFQEALGLCLLVEDHLGVATCQSGIANYFMSNGDYDKAISAFQEAFRMYEALGDFGKMAAATRKIAMSYVSGGNHDECYRYLQEALGYARQGSDKESLAWTLTDCAVEHALHGKLDESTQCFAEAHQLCIDTSNWHMRSIVFWQEAETAHRLGQFAKSVELHRESVRHALQSDFREGLKWILVSMASSFLEYGEHEAGAKVTGFVLQWRERDNRLLTGDERELIDPARARVKDRVGGEYEKWEQEGKALSLDEVLTLVQ
ncbi:MAG: tetratricopeptide repeat protein [Chthonomonadaceae bacterium]|nr:tetratricopeptide repeat protein [Chthonomonadaceae bacterium]